jgi:hypothetical protein
MNRTRLLAFTLLVCARASAQDPRWPDTYVSRLQVLALEETLNAGLLASRSATLTLEAWCRDHRLALDPKIVAVQVKGVAKSATPEQRQRLQVGPEEEVRYRRVRLECGATTLSEADNWYVPARLTPEMNRLLETTDTPFGKAVQPLQPYRQTFAVTLLWTPLPPGWESAPRPPSVPSAMLAIPAAILEHRAVLFTAGHQPFSEVGEVYQRQLLAFPPPR